MIENGVPGLSIYNLGTILIADLDNFCQRNPLAQIPS